MDILLSESKMFLYLVTKINPLLLSCQSEGRSKSIVFN